MKKRLFILDTDTGLDDALMLIAAMSIKELEILGITSVNGNVSEQYTCHNNLALMTFLNKKNSCLSWRYCPALLDKKF